MDRKRIISESDKALWRKIKRNGHFTKRKRDMIKHFAVKSVPERSAFNVQDLDKVDRIPSSNSSSNNEGNGSLDAALNDDLFHVTDPHPASVDIDSDLEFEEYSQDPQEFCDEIRKWAIEFQIKHTAINALLSILKCHVPENVLPKCARTLVHTPRSTLISVDDRLGGQYWHYGLKRVLLENLTRIEQVPKNISLNINIDGLPAFKSSTKSFWPILVNIHELRSVQPPLIVGIFCGGSMNHSAEIVNNINKKFHQL